MLENICIFSLVVSGDTIIHFVPFQTHLRSASETEDPKTHTNNSTWSKISGAYPGPAPITFCFAVLLWLCTFNVYYRLHQKDKYQNHVLAVFTIFGFLAPIIWGSQWDWYLINLKSALPTMLFAGIVMSAMGHVAGRSIMERKRKKSIADLPK